MTRDDFINDVCITFERFNGNRPQRRRAPNDGFRLRSMAGKAWDLYERGKSYANAKSAMKAEFFAWWNPLLQIAWMLWGQQLVDWILSKLFPET